ncbi:MAG: 30S ribosomal protein S6 [Spiroplasma sp.]|nr:30S ribosomal protein S6 [Spiroplasma sp.]
MVETKFSNYEIMYIVDDQNPEKANSLKKEFLEILTKDDGKLVKEENFIQQFAYKINHKVKGHYFVLQLKTTSKNIDDFSRIFSIKQKQGEVVRKLIINLDDEKINTFKVRKESPKKPEFNRDSKFRSYDPNKGDFKGNRDFKANKDFKDTKQFVGTTTKSNKAEETQITSETKEVKKPNSSETK